MLKFTLFLKHNPREYISVKDENPSDYSFNCINPPLNLVVAEADIDCHQIHRVLRETH